MSYTLAKYILVALLLLPMLAFGIYMFGNVMNDIIGINRVYKAEMQQVRNQQRFIQKRQLERERFEADYDYYQRRKYNKDDSNE